jgi:DNA-directed RNA polymerase subunit RPC12/RpoP
MYRCFRCGREIDPEELKGRIMCIYCGCKILVKERPKIVKKVVV